MTTFQRCTDRGMADQLRREREARGEKEPDVVFGAVDEDGFTSRQIRGAALAGGVAGSLLGGPVGAAAVGAVAGAAAASYAAAKRECEIGEAARGAGDMAADTTEFLLTNQTVSQTIDKYSKGTNRVVNDSLSRTVQRASQVNESVKAKASLVNEGVKQTVHKSTLKASQIKDRVQNKIRRRKMGTDGLEDNSDFYDCFDDDEAIENLEFEDAAEVEVLEEDTGEIKYFSEANTAQETGKKRAILRKLFTKGAKENQDIGDDPKGSVDGEADDDSENGKSKRAIIGKIFTTASSAMMNTSKAIVTKKENPDIDTDGVKDEKQTLEQSTDNDEEESNKKPTQVSRLLDVIHAKTENRKKSNDEDATTNKNVTIMVKLFKKKNTQDSIDEVGNQVSNGKETPQVGVPPNSAVSHPVLQATEKEEPGQLDAVGEVATVVRESKWKTNAQK